MAAATAAAAPTGESLDRLEGDGLKEEGGGDGSADGDGDEAGGEIRHGESFDHLYFDAMEALYFEDMLQHDRAGEESGGGAESSPSPSPSSSSSSREAGMEEEMEAIIAEGPDDDDERGERERRAAENEEGGDDDNILGRVRRSLTRKRMREMARERRRALEHELRSRRRRLAATLSDPAIVVTMDKVSFVFGVLVIMVIEAVLLLAPEWMGALYAALLVPLMVARYVIYRADLYHYFMYDFCYFAQVLMLLHMYRYPDDAGLGKALFAISNGPLALAIVMWRNSLVFHSLDKMTSMFIHILPSLVMFSRRWGEHLETKEFPLREPMDGTAWGNLKDFWLGPFGYYAAWQVGYLIKTEVISKRKLEYNTEIATSLRWMTRKKDSASYRLLSYFGEHNQLLTFVTIQAIYTLATFLIVPLLWHSIWLHAVYLGVIFVIAVANGATYYFHVFAKRYIEEIGKRVAKEEDDARRRNATRNASSSSSAAARA